MTIQFTELYWHNKKKVCEISPITKQITIMMSFNR